jgi:Ca2+-binding RTX toxin-like protein
VFGNLGDNVLSGLAGNDQLAGLAGEDLLLGGDGNDTLFAGDGDDTLVGGAGSDVFKVFGSSPVGLDTLADLNGLPGGDKIDVVGMVGFVPGASNVNDFLKTATINGSTVIQVDKDGTANGVSFVDLAVLQGLSTDIAGLLANGVLVQGADVLEPSTKAFQGGSGADSHAGSNVVSDLMFGLAGNDTLTGDVGADTLDGGTGMDLLVGGSGSDSYVIDSVGDKISETGVDTDDRILASIGIDLTVNAAVYAGIEHVTLTGSSALNATGNGFANMLIGNSGANHLDGKVGNDTLIGGAGNDVYEVDSSDQVIELANEGIDQVNSSANFTLGANIENLTLTGASSISGQGNDLANKITGNAASNGLVGLGGNDTLIGNDGNDGLDGGTGADSMVGGAGNDTYAVDDAGDKVMENGPSTDTGDTVQSLITYTLGANLENLIQLGSAKIDGTGNNLDNLLSGNSADNLLSGLAGADIIDGSLGNDLLLGGDGNDTLHASVDADTLVGGAGSDVFQFFSFSVQGVDAIADLNALGGDKIDVTSLLTGFVPGVSDVDDFLTTVTVNGSTVLEVDKDGTANGVTFFDMVVLQGVSTDIDGLLANGVLVRAGDVLAPPPTSTFQGGAGADSHAGTALSDLMFGLAGNDTLTGNAGADTLDGGAGTDSLVGGAGNDTYVVDSAGDKISETGAEANDRMLASISIDLTVNAVAYLGIEHVTLTGSAALNATGNASSNMLIGNSGANHLDGRGGPDTMIGGAGNDIYEVDDSSDQVIDELNGGIDQVNSSAIGFALGVGVENLTLTGNAAGGTGNDLANKITGNAAANFLSGGGGNDTLIAGDNADDLDGGTGADSMTGGTGTDTYHVDDIGDKVAESGPAGEFDQVRSSISYTLGANLEGLVLTGSATVDGTGNSLNNSIFGNDADNVLSGLAGDDDLFGAGGNDLLLGGDGNDVVQLGAGLDTAIGGAGNDAFQFNGGLNGLDVIADFTGGDVIDLSGLLSGFDFASDNINDFLKTSTANGNTTIQADVDGTANGVAFVDAVVLEGVSTDLAGLLTNGNLVV